jgi:wyosine [tRNA(Phe)-imidazoG37] synthetase (radical SAM superfamily)
MKKWYNHHCPMNNKLENAWRSHERKWKNNFYVYAVISRRSHGISVGINLNPDKICNFNCVYCQVDRSRTADVRTIDLQKLDEELELILKSERSGLLYRDAPFDVLSTEERGIRDIAFSGNGEPTASPHFAKAVALAVRAKLKFQLNSTRLILLTNATCLDKPSVRAALDELDRNNGEIWAKLDAGTEKHFRLINRSHVPLQRILENILDAARVRPLVIQSLWFRNLGAAPDPREIESYCRRLNDLLAAGGKLKNIQLYTIARHPAESSASMLSNGELDHIAGIVRGSVPVPVEISYGV